MDVEDIKIFLDVENIKRFMDVEDIKRFVDVKDIERFVDAEDIKRFVDMEDIKKQLWYSFTPYKNRSLRGALTNAKLHGMSMSNDNISILKKINILLIVDLCLYKSSFWPFLWETLLLSVLLLLKPRAFKHLHVELTVSTSRKCFSNLVRLYLQTLP